MTDPKTCIECRAEVPRLYCEAFGPAMFCAPCALDHMRAAYNLVGLARDDWTAWAEARTGREGAFDHELRADLDKLLAREATP